MLVTDHSYLLPLSLKSILYNIRLMLFASRWAAAFDFLMHSFVCVYVVKGQFKSSIKCKVCSNVSVTFQPFMYLSLPLPGNKPGTLQVRMTVSKFQKKVFTCTFAAEFCHEFSCPVCFSGFSCQISFSLWIALLEHAHLASFFPPCWKPFQAM